MAKHRRNEERDAQNEQATKAALARGDDPAELAAWRGGHVGRGVSERGGENIRDRDS